MNGGIVALLLLAAVLGIGFRSCSFRPGDEIRLFDDNSFDERALTVERPLLVEFWAEWCGYCRALEPMLARLADRHRGRLNIVRLDYDNSPRAVARFGVDRLPLLLYIRRGEVISRLGGAPSEAALAKFVADASMRIDVPGRPRSCPPGPDFLGGAPICEQPGLPQP